MRNAIKYIKKKNENVFIHKKSSATTLLMTGAAQTQRCVKKTMLSSERTDERENVQGMGKRRATARSCTTKKSARITFSTFQDGLGHPNINTTKPIRSLSPFPTRRSVARTGVEHHNKENKIARATRQTLLAPSTSSAHHRSVSSAHQICV